MNCLAVRRTLALLWEDAGTSMTGLVFIFAGGFRIVDAETNITAFSLLPPFVQGPVALIGWLLLLWGLTPMRAFFGGREPVDPNRILSRSEAYGFMLTMGMLLLGVFLAGLMVMTILPNSLRLAASLAYSFPLTWALCRVIKCRDRVWIS